MENATVDLDFWFLIRQGTISTYPLLVCSILMLGVVISAAARAVSEPRSSRGSWCRCGAETSRRRPRRYGATASPARRVYGDVLGPRRRRRAALSNIADERQFEEVEACGTYLWILGTIGSSAPFIGLFGTVVGIMRAFHAMRLTGTGGFGVVAGGISEALIATALGIAVGIVSLIFYNYLQNRVEQIDAALRIGSGRLIEAVAAARGHNGAV
jgi:biopolymer transport protein ExbB